MFTGLIEETGILRSFEVSSGARRLRVRAPRLARETRCGDSVAVNGCCLTVTARSDEELWFDLLEETVSRTNLSQLEIDQAVNLERALAAGAPMGGHFVQGHVDCTAQITSYQEIDGDHRLEIALPSEQARYVAEKGSITVDGISLTVAEIKENSFVVWIVPHTRKATNLKEAQPGTLVNLEFDLLAKYVERMLSKPAARRSASSRQPGLPPNAKTRSK
jgi:riboflavin synthase, alpha subunit